MRLKFIFTLAVVCGISFTIHAQQTAKITSANTAYLEYLPQGYNDNSNDYPIVLFLHGIGERGTTSTDPATLKSSVQKVANVGLAKYVKYGQQYPFILISPQLKSSYGRWTSAYVMEVLNHVKKYLRINEKRIYITGLSLGGYGTWTTLGDYPEVFAAAVPICSGGSALSKACDIAAENIPLWAFHGTGDKVVSYLVTTKMINAVNACTPKPDPLAKVTLFSGMGHNVWDKTYKETNALNWMLSFTNGSAPVDDPVSTTNIAPVANAGSDKTTSSSTITLNGSGTDKDGKIMSYKWIKYSGGDVTLTNASSPSVTVSGMKDGSYYLRLTVTDDKGATDYDNMRITVSGAGTTTEPVPTTNTAPIANAGSDKATSNSSIILYGSGTDKDGKIVSYHWTKYQGGAVTLTNENSPNVTVSGMKDGKYFFRLTVTDDRGATDYDNMLVSVSGSSTGDASQSTVNVPPVANAGPNRETSATSITLNGLGSDKDGKIVSYKWTQYGGAAATLTNAGSPNVTVSGLREGSYYFTLTVTDDRGATNSDNMLLKVGKTSSTADADLQRNLPPVAFAGPNRHVTTDYTTVRIYGSGEDQDGEVVSYEWTQYGGPDATLRDRESSTVSVTNLREGSYYLKLTVEDDDGAVHHDNMLLVVDES